LAKEHGPHESFPGSPASKGLLQYDLWGETETVENMEHYDWKALKTDIQTYGLRNSCLIAPMPTASTSQIAGSVCEGIEPLTSNLYTRHTMSGNFVCSNPILIQTLTKLGLWNDAMERELIRHKGSVQAIENIPEAVRTVFKTCFEMKQRWVIDHAKARGVFVDQSMSMNLYFTEPSVSLLSSCHLYGWKNGLKTGMYYLRQKAASESAAFSMEEEVCESCGS
jgi:ribonucleotide reductase alpha subunit